MTNEYKEKCTSDWNLEETRGNVELWSYFDNAEWEQKYAIIMNGRISEFSRNDASPYVVLRIISQL